MSDALYTNWKGQPVTHSSYSSRQTFKKCPREFELSRVQGWSEKERKAAPLFGKCVEAGVQWFEDHDRAAGTGAERFTELWNEVKKLPEFPELKFTASEESWESLLRAGQEMMRIYEVRAPFLPISTHPKAVWQQVLRKKIFPGTELDALENKAILDLLSFPRWNHPMLPPLETEPEDKVRSLIIDIKTSGGDLETELVGLDPQLTEYAWQSRIPDISFLWFVKSTHSLRKGSRVTLLQDAGVWHAGMELTVIALEDSGHANVGLRASLEVYESEVKGLRGKARDAAEAAFLTRTIGSGTVAHVSPEKISKQRLQFAAARLTPQDMDDIGRDVAQTTVEMVRANREGYYPKLAGIRFPNEKCNYCSMRWICLNRPAERDQNLSRKGEEWLDGFDTED